jgi:hypothetical protein
VRPLPHAGPFLSDFLLMLVRWVLTDAMDVEEEEETVEAVKILPPVVRQTLIFSATLSMPDGLKGGKKDKKKQGKKDKADPIGRLMRRMGMRGKAAIVDLSTKGVEAGKAPKSEGEAQAAAVPPAPGKGKGKENKSLTLPEGLDLSCVKSLGEQKDVYLFYFLKLYPGRTIIFTNSIDCVRRLANFLAVRYLGGSLLEASSPGCDVMEPVYSHRSSSCLHGRSTRRCSSGSGSRTWTSSGAAPMASWLRPTWLRGAWTSPW